jgi:hypothetical protein
MSENDRKLLAEVLRAARESAEFLLREGEPDLQRALDNYDLRAEAPIR